jgi:DNA-binding phage protein
MDKSTTPLAHWLAGLSARARALGLSDRTWAARAGVRHETLSRLRHRSNCDLATLIALASAVGARVEVDAESRAATTVDGRFPACIDREEEQRLLDLCVERPLDVGRWRKAGPAFFVAGLAVLLASLPELDRTSLLALAEALHPGSTMVEVFERWLRDSPVRPSRFLPQLAARLRRAA